MELVPSHIDLGLPTPGQSVSLTLISTTGRFVPYIYSWVLVSLRPGKILDFYRVLPTSIPQPSLSHLNSTVFYCLYPSS